MAEKTVDIPVNFDLTAARAQLRAFLEEATRGVTIPLRPGGSNAYGGGQYAAAPLNVPQAEQSAVERAFFQAQQQYRGGYAPIFRPGGESVSVPNAESIPFGAPQPSPFLQPQRDTRGRFVRQDYANAIVPASPMSLAAYSASIPPIPPMSQQTIFIPNRQSPMLGGGRGMNALPYYPPGAEAEPIPGSSAGGDAGGPGWAGRDFAAEWAERARARGPRRPMNVPYDVSGMSPDRQEAAWNDLFDRRYRRTTRRATRAPSGETVAEEIQEVAEMQPAALARRNGRYGGVGTIRGALGLLGVSEVARANEISRMGGVNAGLATSPLEAAQIRMQTVDQLTGGLIGSGIGLAWDQLSANGPTGARMGLAVAAARSQALDNQRFAIAQATVGASIRDASGGAFGRSIASIEGKRDLEVARLTNEISNLKSSAPALADFSPGYQPGRANQIRPQDMNRYNEAVSARNAEIASRQTLIDEARNQAGFDIDQAKKDQIAFGLGSVGRRDVFNMIARGASSRAVERQSIVARYQEQLDAPGIDPTRSRLLERERDAALMVRARGDQQQDELSSIQFQGAIVSTRFQTSNNPFASQAAAIVASTRATQLTASVAGKRGDIELAGQLGDAQLQSLAASSQRDFARSQIVQRGQNAQLTALVNRDPLGATLAGIREQRDEALEATSSLPIWQRPFTRMSIKANAGLQERIARRDDADRRFEIGADLDEEIRQSRFRQAGPRYDVDAIISRISSSAARDERALEKDNNIEGIRKRRTLAREQLREAETDTYRSFSFASANPNSIVGQVDLRGIRKKFSDAEDAVGNQKGDAADSKGVTAEQGQTIIDLIGEVLKKHFRAKAG